ncbi:hypothetical protein CU098_013917 [Rhizopus stolonifer]|uniref:Uncharacterized protein n=1 Tax=Rhizopus stolonifer TaxID=4846 RepID=A0A367KXU4_RHIST|nr:hypothetical protein CU098_013917 [Rhizopus stolonifer]
MSTLQDQIYTDTSDMDVSEDESLPAEDVDSVSSFCTAPCTAEDSSLQEMENEVDRLTEQLNGIDRDNSKIIKELEELQKEQKSMRIAFLEIQARSSLGRNARQTRPTPSSVKTTVSVINSPSITNASSAVNAPSAMNVSSVRNVPIVKEPSSKPVSLPVNKPFFSNNVTPINKSVVVPSTATKAERQMELRKAYERLLQDRQHSKKTAHEIKKRMEPLRAQIKKIELDKVDGVNWNADVKKKLANLLDRVSSEEVLHQTQEQNIKGFTAEVNALVEKSRQEGISLHQIKRSILLDNSQERPLKIEVDNSDNRPNVSKYMKMVYTE